MSRQRFEELIDDWSAGRLSGDQLAEFNAIIQSDDELREEAEMLRSFVETMRSDQKQQKAPSGLLAGALAIARSEVDSPTKTQDVKIAAPPKRKSASVVEVSNDKDKKEKTPWGFYLVAASLGAIAVLSANFLIQGKSDQQDQIAKVDEPPRFNIVEKTPTPFEETVEYEMMTATARNESRTARPKGDITSNDMLAKLNSGEIPESDNDEQSQVAASISAESPIEDILSQEVSEDLLVASSISDEVTESSSLPDGGHSEELKTTVVAELSDDVLKDQKVAVEEIEDAPLQQEIAALPKKETRLLNAPSTAAFSSQASAASQIDSESIPTEQDSMIESDAETVELAMARERVQNPSPIQIGSDNTAMNSSQNRSFENGIEIIAQATPKPRQDSHQAPHLFDEKTVGFLSTQARAANGFMVGSAASGNARLSENHGIEIVGQPKATKATSPDTFTVSFASEAEVEEFFLRIKSVPISSSSKEGEELARRNAMQFPGANALFGESSRPVTRKRQIVTAENLDLSQFGVVTEIDEDTSMIKITLKPYSDGDKRLDSFFPEEAPSQTPKRY